MSRRDKENQPNVGQPGPPKQEHLQTEAEDERAPPPDSFIPEPPAPGKKHDRRERGRDHRWETGREIVFAEKVVTSHLTPVDERRFIEAIFVIEIGDNKIASGPHLARSLGKPRLVPIDQRHIPAPDRMPEETRQKEQRCPPARRRD